LYRTDRGSTNKINWPADGSWTRVRKKSSICLIAAMKLSKSTGLVTYAFACSL